MSHIIPFGRKKRSQRLAAISRDSLLNSYGQEWLAISPTAFQKVLERGFPGDVYGGSLGLFSQQLGSDMNRYATINGDVAMSQNEMGGLRQIVERADSEGNPLSYKMYANGEPVLTMSDPTRPDLEPKPFSYNPAAIHWQLRGNDSSGYFWYPTVRPEFYAQYADVFGRGYIQVTRNPFNNSWLSLGAAGGYRDPRLIEWDDRYGLITPESNYLYDHDSFWESWGPFILASLAIGGVAAGGVISGAGGEVAATTATEAGTAATVAESSAALTETQVAAEEALREIGLAQSLGATVTQGEAAGWVSALQAGGLSVPSDIASIASGIMPSGYQAPPSPSVSSAPTASTPSAATSATGTASTVSSTAGGNTATLLKTASGLVAPATKLLSSQTLQQKQGQITSYAAAPSTGTGTDNFLGLDFSGNATQANQGNIPGTNIHWLWLLVAGAGIYVVARKRRKA